MANKSAQMKKISGGSGAAAKRTGVSVRRKKTATKTKSSRAGGSAKKTDRSAGPTAMYAKDRGLMTAFHHMQRASVVMSLMEKGKGKDLRKLLDRGVKLYRKAIAEGDKAQFVLCAIGVLRAAEHLSIAGLYLARRKHRQRVSSPTPEWLGRLMVETGHRLGEIEGAERGKGNELYGVTEELLRQAQDPKIDAHLTFELAMAADALCFALESGL
jgi:hypothetical protein